MKNILNIHFAFIIFITLCFVNKCDLSASHHDLKGYVPASDQFISNLRLSRLHEKFTSAQIPSFQSDLYKTSQTIELPFLQNYTSDLIYDQGKASSCTANALAFCIRYLSVINSPTPGDFSANNRRMLNPSRSFHYYNTRFESANIESPGNENAWLNSVKQDFGACLYASIIAADKYGACPESIRITEESVSAPDGTGQAIYIGENYNASKVSVQPKPASYRFAFDRDLDGIYAGSIFNRQDLVNTQDSAIIGWKNYYPIVSQHLRYRDITSNFRNKVMTEADQNNFANIVISSLQNSMPVYYGILLNNTFVDKKGFFKTPDLNSFSPTGGHAITLVGYGNYNPSLPDQKYYKFINSWGSKWGQNGFGFLPDTYVNNVSIFGAEGFSIWFDNAAKAELAM